MRAKSIVYIVVVLAVAVTGYFVFFDQSSATTTGYSFGAVTRGNLESTVSATGTLSPTTTVEVGTQVSGTLDSVYVDFNDTVRKGQILAVLDTVLLQASVLESEATLERVEANMMKAQSDYDRNRQLYERKLISESEYLPYEVELKTQQASLKSARSSVMRAKRNLEYAVITSPINGIVINRSVESGQTVAASFSTPTLFEIAEDLSSMEILAEVDETDIGDIQPNQSVRFEVSTYSDKSFVGTVTQIRLQPAIVSNVVTYTVVIEAPNDDGFLLPGMTATIDFITDERQDVLLVPNKALRFQPSEDELNAFRERMQAMRETGGDSLRGPGSGPGAGMRPQGAPGGGTPPTGMGGMMGRSGGSGASDRGRVWLVDSTGQLTMAFLQTGMTDGSNTEILRSRQLTEGMQVIVGVATSSDSASESNSRRSSFGRGRPPF